MSNLTIIANEHDVESLISSLYMSILSDANVYTAGNIIKDDVDNDICWLGIDPTASNTNYGRPMADSDHFIYTTGELALYKDVKGCTDIISSYDYYNNDGYLDKDDSNNSLLRVVIRDDECVYGYNTLGCDHSADVEDLLNTIRGSVGYVNDFYSNKLDLSSISVVSLLIELAHHNLKYGRHATMALYKEIAGDVVSNSITGKTSRIKAWDLNTWYLNRIRAAKGLINKSSIRKTLTMEHGDIHVMYTRLSGLDWFVARRLLTMSKQAYFNTITGVLTDTYSTNVDMGLSRVLESRAAIAM